MRRIHLHILASLMHITLSELILEEDILEPYIDQHVPRRSHRQVRACQPARYNNVTFELYKSHFTSDISTPVYTGFQFTQPVGTYWKEDVLGNFITMNNPFQTFTVLEPGSPGGCQRHSNATVAESGQQKNCLVAMNGGMFNVTSQECLGNVVVDGRVVTNSGGIQNAHFGIKKDSSIFVGYIPENADLSEFKQLIGGVIWLVRDRLNYVAESIKAECEDTQTTSSLKGFADVTSARTAIGHNAAGQVVLIQIDGKTWNRGINLNDFADLLISFGVVNAINLDGGGSATLVINGTLVSHPSDILIDNETDIHYAMAREVTTVLCVHDYLCDPQDCSGHGECHHGKCMCHGNWAGPKCDHVQCGALNCSGHGVCTQDGCKCFPGWIHSDCNVGCPPGKYGLGCSNRCQCANGAMCDPYDGSCKCTPGYAGLLCDQECPYGLFGDGCRQICYCQHSCSCHHITGDCDVSYQGSNFWIASMCLAETFIEERKLVPENLEQYRLWLITTILLAVIAAASIILNISLICIHCTCTIDTPRVFNRRLSKGSHKNSISSSSSKQFYTNNKTYAIQGGSVTQARGLLQNTGTSSTICSDDADSERSYEVEAVTTNSSYRGSFRGISSENDHKNKDFTIGFTNNNRNSQDSTKPFAKYHDDPLDCTD